MTYGEPLRLPGDFFDDHQNTRQDAQQVLLKLQNMIKSLKIVSTLSHGNNYSFVHSDLAQDQQILTFAYIRHIQYYLKS